MGLRCVRTCGASVSQVGFGRMGSRPFYCSEAETGKGLSKNRARRWRCSAAARGEQTQRGRINRVLLRQYPIGETCLGIAGQHRYSRLSQNRALVHRLRDQMHCAAVQLHPCGKCARVRVQARKGRQQARMDVEHAPLPGVDETGRQQPQVSGEADHFDASFVKCRVDCRFMFRPVVPEGTMINRPHRKHQPPAPVPVQRHQAGWRRPARSRQDRLDRGRRRSVRPCSSHAR